MRDVLWRPCDGVPHGLAISWAGELPQPRCVRATGESSASAPDSPSAIEVLFHLSRVDRSPLMTYRPRSLPHSFDELTVALTTSGIDRGGAKFALARVGEQLLAEQLRRQGFDVQLEAPEQAARSELPGWVAVVDGQPVRLIGDPDVTKVRAFVETHIDVAIVTLGDYEQEFAEYAQVWALEQVTRAQLGSVVDPEGASLQPAQVGGGGAQEAGGLALGGISSFVIDRTMNPLLMSVWRSARLAARGDKDWLSGATDGIADQAGATVGGWAGARAGAMAGALLGPLGAAAGGFLGGVLGKKLGVGLVEKRKQERLHKLLAKRDRLLAQVPQTFSMALETQAKQLSRVAEEFDSVGVGSRFWPSPAALIHRELAAQYRAWRDQGLRRKAALDAWLGRKPKVGARAERGRKLLTGRRLAWSGDLLELRSELVFLHLQILAERSALDEAAI